MISSTSKSSSCLAGRVWVERSKLPQVFLVTSPYPDALQEPIKNCLIRTKMTCHPRSLQGVRNLYQEQGQRPNTYITHPWKLLNILSIVTALELVFTWISIVWCWFTYFSFSLMTTGIAGEEELVLYALGVVCLFCWLHWVWFTFSIYFAHPWHLMCT